MNKDTTLKHLEHYKNLKEIQNVSYVEKGQHLGAFILNFFLYLLFFSLLVILGTGVVAYEHGLVWVEEFVKNDIRFHFLLIILALYLVSVSLTGLQNMLSERKLDKKKLKNLKKHYDDDFLKEMGLFDKRSLSSFVQHSKEKFKEHQMFLKYNRFFLVSLAQHLKADINNISQKIDIQSEEDIEESEKKMLIECGLSCINNLSIEEFDELSDNNDSENRDNEIEMLGDESIVNDSTELDSDLQR